MLIICSDNGESLLLQLLLTIAPGDEAISKIDKALHLQSSVEKPVEDIVEDMCLDDIEVVLTLQGFLLMLWLQCNKNFKLVCCFSYLAEKVVY